MTDKYKEYLKSKEWKQKRREALRKAHYLCELCTSKLRLQVHHKTYRNIYRENPEDLIVLCFICHRERHSLANIGTTITVLPPAPSYFPPSKKRKWRRKRLKFRDWKNMKNRQ